MYDYRLVYLILSAPIFSFFLGTSSAEQVESTEQCELYPAKSWLFSDSQTMQQFARYFPDCAVGMQDEVICWLDESDDDAFASIYRFSGDGRQKKPVSIHTYKLESAPSVKVSFGDDVQLALKRQEKFLRGKQRRLTVDGLTIRDSELRATIAHLKTNFKKKKSLELSHFEHHHLRGLDGRGNVQFTAYFTPIIKVQRHQDKEHRFALYKRPAAWKSSEQVYLSRKEIDGEGALAGQGLEIAWTDNPFDIFSMQVQGSGLAFFDDGSSRILAFDGKNGHPYVSIGRLLVEDGHISAKNISLEAMQKWFAEHPDQLDEYLYRNPSYVFFKPRGKEPKGASGLPLVAGHSIAVDPTVIPYGSVLLARVPILDDRNRLQRHEWRLLFAQDTGSAIKGPGHVDLYMGIGDEAKRRASAMHHYGEMWLLLKRKAH